MIKNTVYIDSYLDTLREVLSSRRKLKSISQASLARTTGLSRWYISDIERGTRSISIKNLAKLSMGLEIPLSELLREVEDKVFNSGNKCSAKGVDNCFFIVERDNHSRYTVIILDDYLEAFTSRVINSQPSSSLFEILNERTNKKLEVWLNQSINSLAENNGEINRERIDKSTIHVKPVSPEGRSSSMFLVLIDRELIKGVDPSRTRRS